jgi:hypothetical protein
MIIQTQFMLRTGSEYVFPSLLSEAEPALTIASSTDYGRFILSHTVPSKLRLQPLRERLLP